MLGAAFRRVCHHQGGSVLLLLLLLLPAEHINI